jgi:hypothetical protein
VVNSSGVALGLTLAANSNVLATYPLSDPFWPTTVAAVAQLASSASPTATLVVGYNQQGTCTLAMPQASTQGYGFINFSSSLSFEPLLDALDALGARVVVEIQPGYGDLTQVTTLVANNFKGHTSVVGIGIDVRHVNTAAATQSADLGDSDAKRLVQTIQQIQPSYQLYLKASSTSAMPSNAIAGIVFVAHQQGFTSQAAMVQGLQTWANAFAPAPVQFDIGVPTDPAWWCSGSSAALMAQAPIAAVLGLSPVPSNLTGLSWQAESLAGIYPSPQCIGTTPAATAPATTAGANTGTATAGAGTATTGGTGTAGNTTTAGGGTATTAGATATAGSTSATAGTAGTAGTTAGATTAGGSTTGTATAGGTGSTTSTAGATTAGGTSSGTATAGATTAGSTGGSNTTAGATTAGGTGSSTATAGATTAAQTTPTAGSTTAAQNTTGGTTGG